MRPSFVLRRKTRVAMRIFYLHRGTLPADPFGYATAKVPLTDGVLEIINFAKRCATDACNGYPDRETQKDFGRSGSKVEDLLFRVDGKARRSVPLFVVQK